MANDLVNEQTLMEWLDYKQRGRIESWLRENRIPFFYGRDGMICTTQSAINNRLLGAEPNQEKRIEF